MANTYHTDCPECDGQGHTYENAADGGHRSYRFDCLRCWGTGRIKP